jgi:hypothetical protein
VCVSVTDPCAYFRQCSCIWYGPGHDCHVAGMGLVCVANDSSSGDGPIFTATELEGTGALAVADFPSWFVEDQCEIHENLVTAK